MADSNTNKGFRRFGRHYLLLLWKNLILTKRTPIRTFLEITLPVFFGFLLLGIRHIVKSEIFLDGKTYPSFSIDNLPPFPNQPISMVAYAPQTNFTNEVMKRAAAQLGLAQIGYDNETALVEDVNKKMPQSPILGGVVFTNLTLELNITYKIRLAAKLRNSGLGNIFNGQNNWRTNLLYPLFPVVGPRNSRNTTGGAPGYYQEGFLALQRAVDMEILNELNPTFNSSEINIQLQRYPFPPYKEDNFVLVIQVWFPFLLVMSYIFAAINTVKNIVYEKEKGLKIAMTIMGLNSWIHWLSWFTRSLVFLTIADILIAVCYIVKVPLTSGGSSSVIGESDITLVFFFLFTYSITSICFMFFISTLFDKANSAAAGTGGLWFLSYLPYAFIQPRYETMTRGAKLATCMLHNIGLALGAQLIGMFEGKGTGIQWSMFNEAVSIDDNFTMADVIIMLYVDAVIYLLLALYIENIWPGEYGIPKGVLYPFKLSYWRGSTKSRIHHVNEAINESNDRSSTGSTAFESEPTDKELGVQLINVSKTYSFLFKSRPPVHAVSNLSMNIYSGQLTALLGHNGAGKSTTISMITGLIPPTSGHIIVNGYDIATSMDNVRNTLGLCPQYNILFDHLTVREHLRLRTLSIDVAISKPLTMILPLFPRSLVETITDFQSQQFFGFRMASSIVFGFGFMMASFAVFLIKERVSKAKHLQFLSGASGINFWLSTFIWDLVYYIVATICILIIWTIFYHTAALKDDLIAYLDVNRLGYTILLYLLYGFAHIPMTYLLSFIFQIPASGFAWMTIINIITSQATLLAVVILSIPQLDLVHVADILEWIFLILFPNFCLGQGLNNMYQNYALNELCGPIVVLCDFMPNPCCKNNCNSDCVSWTTNYLSWEKPGIGRFLVFMGIQSVVLFAILLFITYQILPKCWFYTHRKPHLNNTNYAGLENNNRENTANHTTSSMIPISDGTQISYLHDDEDVQDEAERIQTTSYDELMQTDVLVLNQVSKLYSGTFRAVDQLCLGVKQRECFGLLGVNGAGKTTTFKMITGDETVDQGSIIVDSIDLSGQLRTAQRRMGYCPQFDALIDLLTGEETLYMFARLRGVKEHLIPRIVLSLIELMSLQKHAKKPVYAYSGGNKRKLSAAVSLIGDPSIVFLDEPTTGMDPKARRHFWNAIAQFRDHGKPIILTSHSMEECEALCTRLAIMVNGKFKCLGSIQHLKSKFGAGYTLMAKLNVFNETLVNGFYSVIKNSFANIQLKEAYEGFVHIHINEANISLAQLFRIIESCKQTYSIENYTVSQTTLEQVFLNFARSQLDPDELRHRMRKENSWSQKLTKSCCHCC
ncbi:unnamed protein product [Rotaria sp. Silwood2]|nr:unnamed protein product [Rotaria sp. Silwood2]